MLVGASTHPGEDDVVLDAFVRVRAREPRARLLLAPRKLDHLDDIDAAIAARGLTRIRRSALPPGVAARWPADADVLVLDGLGELAGLYAGARVAFVGGTLVPIGGHNVLEPAAVGTAVAVGPHTANVAADVARLVANDAALQAASAPELVARMAELGLDPGAAAAAGTRAAATVGEQQGPLAVTLAIVRGTLAADTASA